jgi:hypothetical protein
MRVIVDRCDVAPRSYRWQAMEQDYDLGVPVGSGPTPLAAIADLLWRLDIEDIAPEQCDIVWVGV